MEADQTAALLAFAIITNHVPRDILNPSDLTERERAELDYFDWSKLGEGGTVDFALFFRYKGETYDLGEFEVWTNPESPMRDGGWDGFQSDSFFSGILVRYVDDCERVIVGRYYS